MTKFKQLLACLEQAINDHRTYGRIGNKLSEQQKSYAADKYFAKANRRIRQIDTFRARLLSMYSLDFLRRLENSRNHWTGRAIHAEAENRQMRERLKNNSHTIMRLIDICQEHEVEIDYCEECGGVLPVHEPECRQKDGDS